jgi:hypothetical protein
MQQAIIRIYASESQGAKAAATLREEGFTQVYQFSGSAEASDAATETRSTVIASMMSAHILKNHAEIYADRLAKGESLVLVYAPFFTGVQATEALDSHDPIDKGLPDRDAQEFEVWDEAAPLSSALSMPVLLKTKLPVETISGVPSITRGKAFLSNLFRIPLLIAGPERRTSSMGLPMLSSSATPLSSMIGLPTLSNSAAPLSSLFRLPTSTARS